MNSVRPATLASAVLVVLACGPGDETQTTETDAAAIRTLYREWPRTVEAEDPVRYAEFLHDSVTLMIPGAPLIHGVDDYQAALVPLFEAATYRVDIEPPAQLEIIGPWAFARYQATLITYPRDGGDSTIARNRYVDILRRDANGAWKVYLHSWHASP